MTVEDAPPWLREHRRVTSKYLNRSSHCFTATEQLGTSVFQPEVAFIRQLIVGVNTVKLIRSYPKRAFWHFEEIVLIVYLAPNQLMHPSVQLLEIISVYFF